MNARGRRHRRLLVLRQGQCGHLAACAQPPELEGRGSSRGEAAGLATPEAHGEAQAGTVRGGTWTEPRVRGELGAHVAWRALLQRGPRAGTRGTRGWGCKQAGPGLGLVAPLRQVAIPGRGRSPGEGLFGEEERPAGKPALEAPWRRGGGGVCKASHDPVWADSPEDGAAVPQISGDSACLTGNSDSLSLWLPATYIERVFVNINH